MPPEQRKTHRQTARSLARTQATLFAAITEQSTGQDAPGGAQALVVGDARASAAERVAIYARMYQSRLVETLEAQFPRLARRLGPAAFADLAAAYAADHPSRSPSLRSFGQHLDDHLRWAAAARPPSPDADLARLEWARNEVFDDADERVLVGDELRALLPDRLAALPLRLIVAARLITVDAAIPALWKSTGADGDDPEVADFTPRGPASVLVWRQGVTVYHRAVDAPERAALDLVAGGCQLGVVCETLAEALPADRAVAQAFAWLSSWLADGLLAVAP